MCQSVWGFAARCGPAYLPAYRCASTRFAACVMLSRGIPTSDAVVSADPVRTAGRRKLLGARGTSAADPAPVRVGTQYARSVSASHAISDTIILEAMGGTQRSALSCLLMCLLAHLEGHFAVAHGVRFTLTDLPRRRPRHAACSPTQHPGPDLSVVELVWPSHGRLA